MHIYIYLQNLLSVHNKSKNLAVITNYSVSQLLSHSLFFHFFEQRSSESSVGISIERGGGRVHINGCLCRLVEEGGG